MINHHGITEFGFDCGVVRRIQVEVMDETPAGLPGTDQFLDKWGAVCICCIPAILPEEFGLKREGKGVPLTIIGKDIEFTFNKPAGLVIEFAESSFPAVFLSIFIGFLDKCHELFRRYGRDSCW
jgi:hypothetical protein